MTITYADIRRFIFHLKDRENKKASTINVYTATIRFFFEYTLGYVWDPKKVPKMKRDRQLPVILTREQVNLLIDSMDNYKHKAITATMYSSGMRVSEVCHLRYKDVRRKQKMIYVSRTKNRWDRYTILSEKNLDILTEYWYRCNRPREWLFPGMTMDKPLSSRTVEQFIRKHAKSLELPKGITPHTMRHCFACHALEDGVSHTFIQQLLGHRSASSTDVYYLYQGDGYRNRNTGKQGADTDLTGAAPYFLMEKGSLIENDISLTVLRPDPAFPHLKYRSYTLRIH